MKTKQMIKKARQFSTPFRVTRGPKFKLKDFDPGTPLILTPRTSLEPRKL